MLIHHDLSDIQDQNDLCLSMRKVFGWSYVCRLKQMHILDEEEINQVGIPTTLNHDYDYEFANVLVNAKITISDMAELFHDGITFQITENEDIEKIYMNIRDYLLIAAEALNERNVNDEMARNNPHIINFIKDIQKFEALGNALYPMFAHGKVTNTKLTGFGATRRLNSIRQGRLTKEVQLSEEEKRIQQRFHLDFRRELIPFVKESTSVWFRKRS